MKPNNWIALEGAISSVKHILGDKTGGRNMVTALFLKFCIKESQEIIS